MENAHNNEQVGCFFFYGETNIKLRCIFAMAIEEEEREEINCTNFQMFGKGSQKAESNWSAESSQRNIGAHSSFTVTGMARSYCSSDFGLQHCNRLVSNVLVRLFLY